METEKAEACKCVVCHYPGPVGPCVFNDDAAGSTCSDATHGCGSGNNFFGFSDSVCLIGGPYDRAECDDSVGIGCPANNGWKCCSENNCTVTGTVDNGDTCRVSTDANGCSFTEGVWDSSDGKCVRCNGLNREMDNCGDSGGTYFDGTFCTGTNDALFESACGADSACDEVENNGDPCAVGELCESGEGATCVAGGTCDVNGHCVSLTDCTCAEDDPKCCNGAGCVATDNGDPDCPCEQLNGTNCGVGLGCDIAAGSSVILNHATVLSGETCCDGACAGGCVSTCFTGHCLLALANATATADVCCNGAGNQCFECNSGYVWNSGSCVVSGGGSTHGNYTPFDKDVVLVLMEGAEFLLRIAGGIALFIIIFGGIYYMVSGASPDGQMRAKKIVTYAVIGLAIVLVSYVIIATIESFAV